MSRTPSRLAPRPAIGPLLRDWRQRRRLSQLDLSLDVGVSARHLSFIETGRARPSPQMLMALAERLEVPLRERNQLLLAAGYAPRYAEGALDEAAMQPVRAALQRLLDAHQPYPGVVLDRQWNVVLANRAAGGLAGLLPAFLKAPVINVFRASLHPEGLARYTTNFEAWARHLIATLQRGIARTGDAQLQSLLGEVSTYPRVQSLLGDEGAGAPSEPPPLLLNCELDLPAGRLNLFTTLTSFGMPNDVTLDELCVELFYPADDESAGRLVAWGQAPAGHGDALPAVGG